MLIFTVPLIIPYAHNLYILYSACNSSIHELFNKKTKNWTNILLLKVGLITPFSPYVVGEYDLPYVSLIIANFAIF